MATSRTMKRARGVNAQTTQQAKRLQQFREIDQKLQEIVPKIAELNVICREIGRDNVFYEPEIMTEVRTDGFMSQFSQVQRVYQRYFNNHAHPKIIGVALNYFP